MFATAFNHLGILWCEGLRIPWPIFHLAWKSPLIIYIFPKSFPYPVQMTNPSTSTLERCNHWNIYFRKRIQSMASQSKIWGKFWLLTVGDELWQVGDDSKGNDVSMSVQQPEARRKRSTKIIFVNSRVLRRLDITRIAVENIRWWKIFTNI